MLHKLLYISQGITPVNHIQNIELALEAGVKFIQLRLKDIEESRYIDFACITKEMCNKFEAALIINDNANVAKYSKADALHLGLNDMAIDDARKTLPDKIIGGTANTINDVLKRCSEKANYIGLGPYNYTTTKQKLSPVLGIGGYSTIIQQMKKENLSIPVYAIGGIEFKDIEPIIKTGAYGIAVSRLITHSNQKEKLVKEINKILYHA